jgi:cytochrome P450
MQEILAESAEIVHGADSWLSVIAFWGAAPLSLSIAFMTAVCKGLRVRTGFGALRSVENNRKLYSAPIWWISLVGSLFKLIFMFGSRLGLFSSDWKAFGGGRFWIFGEAIWCGSYKDCEEITRSEQYRKAAFAGSEAPTPEIFPSIRSLIFLSNDSSKDSEWAVLRGVFHKHFLNLEAPEYQRRTNSLKDRLMDDWAMPAVSDLNDKSFVQRIVSKCIFYVFFGVWLDESDAKILCAWRSLAPIFVFPRLGQRILLNLGVCRVRKLREDTVGIIEKYGLTDIFMQMNDSLPEKYRRQSAAELCDVIMFDVGFAGIGGTSACVETVGQFLHLKVPAELPRDMIDFGNFHSSEQMITACERNPMAYIKEACRLNPPVTSATHALKEAGTIDLSGRTFSLPRGTLNAYCIGFANRDETVFEQPQLFNPERHNLDKALTWNGVMSSAGNDEQIYPRLCPGRFLSQEIALSIVRHALAGAHGHRA